MPLHSWFDFYYSAFHSCTFRQVNWKNEIIFRHAIVTFLLACTSVSLAKHCFHAPDINTSLCRMYITWNLWNTISTCEIITRVEFYVSLGDPYEIIITRPARKKLPTWCGSFICGKVAGALGWFILKGCVALEMKMRTKSVVGITSSCSWSYFWRGDAFKAPSAFIKS